MRSSRRRLQRRNKHAALSPSASSRWLSCTASPGFIAKHSDDIPSDDGGSKYAREGTEAHEYGSRLLNGEKRVLPANPRDTEMIACISGSGYVQFVRNELEKLGPGAEMFVEVKVKLFYDPGEEGTCDVLLIGKRKAVIIDLKYGQGISVEAKFNSQLAIYAESAIRRKWPSCKPNVPVEMVIYQPRAEDNRIVRKWSTDRGALAEFCKWIDKVATSILEDPDDQTFKPEADTTCRFCPAKALCGHYAAHLLEEVPKKVRSSLLIPDYRLEGLPKVEALEPRQLIKFLRVRKELNAYLDQIEKTVLAQLLKGKKLDGLKLVRSKTNRDWTDEAKAHELLMERLEEDQLYVKKFVSPSAASKLLVSSKVKPSPKFVARVDKLITKAEGEPSVALKEDPRPPIDLDPLEGLENVTKSARKLL